MIQNAFNSGEITPLMHARPEVGVYATGCKRLLNMRALIYGGASRDPGTQHLGGALGRGRLIAFEFSSEQRFQMEFSHLKLRVWSTGETPAVVATLDTPYTAEQLRAVQYAPLNNLVLFSHPQQFPQMLRRTGPSSFAWSEYGFINPPMMDQNADPELIMTADAGSAGGATVWASGVSYKRGDYVTFAGQAYVCGDDHISTGANDPSDGVTYLAYRTEESFRRSGIQLREISYPTRFPLWEPAPAVPYAPTGTILQLASSKPYFGSDLVGSSMELAYRRELSQRRVRKAFPSSVTQTSDSIDVDGDFTISTTGNWTGKTVIEQSVDLGNTWDDLVTYESAANANYIETHTTAGPVLLRLRLESTSGVANNPEMTLTASDPFSRSLVRILLVTNATTATIETLSPIRGRAATFWSAGAFSGRQGFPKAVCFHRQRLWFGGSSNEPQKVWASAIDQYDIFRRRELSDEAADADQSFTFNIVSNTQNRISYLSSQKELVAGTVTSEWAIAGDQQNGTLGPGSYQVIPIANFGSEGIQPLDAQIGLIFLQRGGRSVRHIGALTDVLYSTPELQQISMFGEHLIRSGIVDHAYQRSPQPIYWGVTADGRLVGHTHNPSQKVLAWHDHDFGPRCKVLSVSVCFSDFEEDQVWLLLEHTRDDDEVSHTVERFALGQTEAQEAGDFSLFRFLHHHQTFPATASVPITISSMGHLAGRTVWVYLDGQVIEKRPALESFSVVPPAAGTVVVGCPYECELETLPPVMQTQAGVQGFMTTSQIGRAYVLPYKSGPGRVKVGGNSTPNWVFRSAQAGLENLPPLSNEPAQIDGVGGYSDRSTISITSDGPYPFTILGVNYAFKPRETI